jgi:subtilase family serine protease
MKSLVGSFKWLVFLGGALGIALGAWAQQGSTRAASEQLVTAPTPQAGCFSVPESNGDRPYHTNYLLASEDCKKPAVFSTPTALRVRGPVANSGDGISPDITLTEVAETPQSLGCLYVKSPSTTGCVPNYNPGSGGPSSEGYGAIAIVDAYDNPDAATDLSTFDGYWGLAAPPSFTKVYANGNGDCTTPAPNAGWSVEESLDIEWAHVFAPKAAIVLVEACSNSDTDLYYAEQVAFDYIETNFPGVGGQVTNSWGGDEFSGEISDDPFFADWSYTFKTHILALASAGDCGYLDEVNNGGCYSPGNNNYPSVSPWVVSAGGTSVKRNAATLDFYSEECWSGSGGGPSAYETYKVDNAVWTGGNIGPWAPYQYPIFGSDTTGATRTTPDLAFDADPASGVYIYNQYSIGGWAVIGGTSVSSPSLASIINRADNRLGSVLLTALTSSLDYFSTWENNMIYSQLSTDTAYKANFYDVKTGSNGGPGAKVSYDECTGVGSPRGLFGK